MITILLTIFGIAAIIAMMAILGLILGGIGVVAWFAIKVLFAIGLVYVGIKVLSNLF